ncbi:hypothetical protein M2139_001867 [Enterococcus sp. PF1-24]|uniref:hypothetical protein n=1 Tax=unclassified Enterococcus TaxID=2608891 RepID=UPI0024732BEE|nr:MULTISPECIES: hypothetical protein [unclassified Enterococcus]MDH6364809.1 hypothetical protein [Enterococcus sp. PFB1-1]MDH6401967.1 hypothetical protein [Enterococcus sp. PF1-24]
MNTKFTLGNIFKIALLLIVGGIVLSTVLGVVSGLLWLVIRLALPLAILIWIVRMFTEPRNRRNRRHY